MKISEKTQDILDNFSTINRSMLFRPGNKIATIAASEGIYAVATVDENFELEFGIDDLKRFKSVLSMFEDPTLKFGKEQVTISSGKQKVHYTYKEPSLITAPPDKEIKFGPVITEFKIDKKTMKEITKLGSLLGSSDVVFYADGKTLSVMTVDSRNPTGDDFTVDVADTEEKFRIVVSNENMKIIPDNYDVRVSKNLINFGNDVVQYYVAVEKKKSEI